MPGMKAKIFFCTIFCLVQFQFSSPQGFSSSCGEPSQCNVRSLLLTAYNIRYFATYFTPTATIRGRAIEIGPGTASEKLLEVPLGEVNLRATVEVTVGLNKSHPNTPGVDSDFRIGISDGTNNNQQVLVDINNYGSFSPCYTVSGSHDERRVSLGTEVPATFKLLFVPFYKYGSCETVQEGGYINTGTFAAQIDTSKPLFLRMFRGDAPEQYFFYYVNVDIY